MNCPRCDQIALEKSSLREFGITYDSYQCPQCAGSWIDLEQLQDIEMTIESRFVEFRRIPSESVQQVRLQCPACSQVEMEKVRSERDRKVVMDICGECNHVWLDGGEIRAIKQESLPALIIDTYRWLRSRKTP